MKKAREDNTVSVVQRAIKHYGIRVTQNSVKETLKSNSYYPTFRSICDAFSEWKIEHYPLKYDYEEIKDLKSPYIAHFNSVGGQIAFVTGYENGNVVLYDSFNTKKKIGWDEYIKKSSGAIILLNPDENSGEISYMKKLQEELLNRLIIPVITGFVALVILTLLIDTVFNSGYLITWQQYMLILTKFTGIFFCGLLLLREYEITLSLTEKLCHINKSVNCNFVLNDKAALAFGSIGWADIGMIYFIGSLLVLLQGNLLTTNGFLIAASALSLPYTIYSIYYQGWRLKKWCPLCLMVQVVLIAEFLLQSTFFSNAAFSYNLFLTFILTFWAIGGFQVIINLYVRAYRSERYSHSKLVSFKRQPEVLHALLFKQKQYHIIINNKSLLFGDKNSSLKITAFLSLNCSHCAGAFLKIAEVLRSGISILVVIVILGGDSKILDTLYFLLQSKKEEEALNILDHWYKSDHFLRRRFVDDYCVYDADEVSKEINSENQNLIRDCEIIGTPTFFINGYKLPTQYEIDDIIFFSENLNRK